ncbi:MAG: potassium transporter TrkG [Oscillospiraceae bacterium]|nr:potassium transporter TrkG [Oscillospiraceae bacterium]
MDFYDRISSRFEHFMRRMKNRYTGPGGKSLGTRALKRLKRKPTTFQTIIFGFAAVIFFGALLLMLPISSTSRHFTPFNDALFTSVSAVCVTGLVVVDTATYWSFFGQLVIIFLIQIGGLGVVTVAASIALLSGRRISLMQRSTMQEAISAPKVGGIVRLTGFILKFTFLIEAVGAILMAPAFIRDFGPKGIWMAVFTSISAFCNAGFDVMGTHAAPFASMMHYCEDPLVVFTLTALIIIGGLGFLTWDDIRTNRQHLRRYRMQSKVIILTSFILILIPTLFFLFIEFDYMPFGKRILPAFFQAVTPRTAGFNTVDLTVLSGAAQAMLIALMLIGGSPGSTAGGMKTTTIAVLLANALAVFRRREDAEFFGRRIDSSVVKNAATILMMYISAFVGGAIIISVAEDIPLSDCAFETASAVGTVGLSLGITPHLGLISQLVLMALMFLGRVGSLTLIYAVFSGTNKKLAKLPLERITVG